MRAMLARIAVPGLDREMRAQRQAARLGPERLKALQLGKLNALLDRWRKVDFYGRLLADYGAPAGPLGSLEELRRLPVVTRDFLRAHRARIAALPTAARAGSTSGSTGAALYYWLCRPRCVASAAATVLAFADLGLDYWSDRRFTLWTQRVLERRWVRLRDELCRRFTGNRLVNTIAMDEQAAVRFLEQIRRYRPKAVIGFTNSLFLTAWMGRQGGVRPYRPRLLLCSGEKLLAEQRTLIEDYFGAPLYDRYGSWEFHILGQQCLRREVFHVPPTRVYLESDERGDILVTDLDNTATPFIRYANGDMGRVGDSRCPCGRAGQVVQELFGRTDDVILTPSGKSLPGYFWASLTRTSGGVEQFQVIQWSPGRVELRVVPNGRYRPAHAEQFRRHLRRIAGDEVELDVVTVDRIEPTPAGKHRFVIRMDPSGRPAAGPP